MFAPTTRAAIATFATATEQTGVRMYSAMQLGANGPARVPHNVLADVIRTAHPNPDGFYIGALHPELT